MAESVSITTTPPDFQSMQYTLLRDEGIKHLQSLAGKIWTDYNLSDPGVSMLEVLSYAITDLGYRSSYSIPDILAQDPSQPQVNIKNFYTAREILPMYPVTQKDYRKLLIDVDVHDPSDIGAEFAGVKNAWIEVAPDYEIPVYVNQTFDKLDYVPEDISNPDKVNIRCLHNVLLELDTTDKYGDLNENTIEQVLTISSSLHPEFAGLKIKVDVEFPRWDEQDVDWDDLASIQSHVKRVNLVFSRLPQGYNVEDYGLYPDKTVWVSIFNLPIFPPITDTFIEMQINSMIYSGTSSMIYLYQQKVKKILQIIAAVRARLMANRNLCEDFYKISAIKVEEIGVCADIDLENDADVEQTLAKIYFEIGKFLAPTVYFYTIEEMYAKGKRTEEIFEGPPLMHGFIDDDELAKADRRKSIHVSDLIRIIMEIPGVIAVKSIQIANVPEDNVDNIPSVSVKWCLDLAFEFNYVPRLSTDLSKITFFKDQLPYKANDFEVDQLLHDLQTADRPQNLENPVLDLPVPEGEFRDIEQYVSTQDEFPLVYGIGPAGLPDSSSDLRKAQARQLKGFLMFFDQLLADYLSQLAHVRDLFSMNEERDAFGNFIIDKSYFTQSLVPSVTGVGDLLVSSTLYPFHLQNITEDEDLFTTRRNKFLDHLMARFAIQFTDYAMVVYKLTGKKAPKELLVDKLEVLNAYPQISAGRFKAMDYESPCELWHVDNVSGLEKRASLLSGIAPRTSDTLFFHKNFKMTGAIPVLQFEIYDALVVNQILAPPTPTTFYPTVDAWKKVIEKILLNGVNSERYVILDNTNTPIGPDNPATSSNSPYTFIIVCDKGETLAVSVSTYNWDPIDPLVNVMAGISQSMLILSNEFYNNVESNRNNLSCPILNYIDVTPIITNMLPDPPTFTFDFTLYVNPFDFSTSNTKLVTGTYVGKGQAKAGETIIDVPANNEIVLEGDFTSKIHISDPVSIKNSLSNDGNYSVTAISTVVIGGNTTTHIQLNTTSLTFSVPLGTLYYNPQTAAQLLAYAQANLEDILFQIMFNGTIKDRYTYGNVGGQYKFNIADRCGDTLATSVESNFNAAMAALAGNHPGGKVAVGIASNAVRITNNTPFNNKDWTISSSPSPSTDFSGNIVLHSNDSPPLQAVAGGEISFDGSISVLAVNKLAHTFTLNGIYNRVFFPGEMIEIINSSFNDGAYTIARVTLNGTSTVITVNENIFDDSVLNSFGALYYFKTFPIKNIVLSSGADIYATVQAESYAVDEMVDFIDSKFFGHEGLHLVEHVLLRPKVNDDLFIPMAGTKTLVSTLSPLGDLEYTKVAVVAGVDLSNSYLFVNGNLLADLSPLMFLTLKDSTANIDDKTYRVVSFAYSAGITTIKVFESIPDDTLPDYGKIYYQKTSPIVSITSPDQATVNEAGTVFPTNPAIIRNSQDDINDGTFNIGSFTQNPSQAVFQFDKVLERIQDTLLPINLRDECENCRVEDPYSFIVSVVVPYWQGRFLNQDFRNFFERTLQLEAPAHIAMNICWVDCMSMKEFELKYKRWLVENSKHIKDKVALSATHNDLVDILERLRSVYPPGVLHDCEDTDTLPNSIILNRTVIGTIQI